MSPRRSMVSLVENYLDYRRRLGFALESSARRLLGFARFADRIGHQGPITQELAVHWARSAQRAGPITATGRLQILRPFAKYCLQFDPATEISPPSLCGPGYRRLTPHIYSDEELNALLAAARHLTPADGLRPATCATVFGLLAATGLRISEAVVLLRTDVNLETNVLTIRQTKFRKSRLVPIHPTTAEELRRYARFRDRMLPASKAEAFFLSDHGEPTNYRQFQHAFACLRTQLGWRVRGGHAAPRLHDLRHGFISRCLLRWYQQGVNVDNAMLSLSTYVGHTQISDTYWYVTAIPELMAIAGERFERFAQGDVHD
jgi:integrase